MKSKSLLRAMLKIGIVAFLVFLVTAGSFMAGFATCWLRSTEARHPLGDTPEKHQEVFRVFWEAWHLIEEHFYSDAPLDPQKMTHGAIEGMVGSLGDPNTRWVDPVEAAIMEEDLSGSFQGIGATVNMVEGLLTIIEPLPDSPAMRAGLRPGDIILQADGKPIKDMDILQAISLVRGPEGTEVRLLIRRTEEGTTKEFEVTIRRARLAIPTVEFKLLPEGVAYLKLNEFNARASSEVRRALRELLRQQPKGLILDLRNNPGGYLSSAIEVASEFIASGVVVRERSSGDEGGTEHRAQRGGIATEIPLAVLVNGFSASASEIVAGAIQDYGRGPLIGETTFGKGSMQMPFTLSDKSSLIVTTARWYTPKDRLIDGAGLAPDIAVERTPEDIRAGRDPQLERAVQYILVGK